MLGRDWPELRHALTIASVGGACKTHGMNLITAKQKAEELGIDRSTLSRWVRDEKIEPVMTLENGAMLFAPADTNQKAAS